MGITSKYNHITNHTQLMYTIMQVNSARAEQEEEIKHKFKELYYELHPSVLLKKAVGKLLHTPEVPQKLLQSGLALGADFIIGRMFKKSASIKGYLTSMIVEKVADYALNSKSEFIQNGIGKIGKLLKNFRS